MTEEITALWRQVGNRIDVVGRIATGHAEINFVTRLIELGSDVNAAEANWFRSVLSWAANNAMISTLKLLLACGAPPTSNDALHAAAYAGSSCGQSKEQA